MINKKVISTFVIVAFIFTTCTFFIKKEPETSFLVKVSADELLLSLSGNSKDKKFREALEVANEMQLVSNEDYITIFGKAFSEIDPNASLATIFSTAHLRNRISFNSTNEEVLRVLKCEVDYAIDRSINILRTRIDRYGIRHQNIKRVDNSENILIELPAVENIDRVRRLIEAKAKLEFWETYEYSEIYNYFFEANEVLRGVDIWEIAEQLKPEEQDLLPAGTEAKQNANQKSESAFDQSKKADLLDLITGELTPGDDEVFKEFAIENPLFAFLMPAFSPDENGNMYPMKGPVVGYTSMPDTAIVNYLLNKEQVSQILPRDLRLYWDIIPVTYDENMMRLLAIRVTMRDGSAPLDDLVITDARQDYDQYGNPAISMSMNREGTRIWRRLTADNTGRSIAMVFDGYVYSYPRVMSEITEGRSSITGQFTIEEAQDLANLLRTGSLPVSVRIVEENIKRE